MTIQKKGEKEELEHKIRGLDTMIDFNIGIIRNYERNNPTETEGERYFRNKHIEYTKERNKLFEEYKSKPKPK